MGVHPLQWPGSQDRVPAADQVPAVVLARAVDMAGAADQVPAVVLARAVDMVLAVGRALAVNMARAAGLDLVATMVPTTSVEVTSLVGVARGNTVSFRHVSGSAF
jgi:hypothetical protein